MSDLYEFTATHGVHLDDLQVKFERDHDAEGAAATYKFATADEKQADALAKVEAYGIKLVSKPQKAKAPTAAEKKAAAKAEAEAAAEKEAAEAAEKAAAEAAASSEDQK